MITTARGAKIIQDCRPCRHCLGTVRYAANRNCVACSRKKTELDNERCKLRNRARRAARRASATEQTAMTTTAHGAKVYKGRRCHRGHSVRYWSNQHCVACSLASDERRKEQTNRCRREMRAAHSALMQNNQQENI